MNPVINAIAAQKMARFMDGYVSTRLMMKVVFSWF
ncbi:hypothetical protein SRABI102_01856 [Stenotrophomonas lactitubi]|nr:hypothetical protein SRABI122_00437 [Stenotrophomonas lactitubi]CAH0155124.1 hypothetical protein SRABI66_00814 [Stenotrophomonas lactitubi]CAH0172070.1 hypothetical protein SRABI81_01237 [Stenotrophomonas lactitubi]CAH0204432.1 hypothetical protein SRABI102_01856 [Stenotrophomonas lactitubi]